MINTWNLLKKIYFTDLRSKTNDLNSDLEGNLISTALDLLDSYGASAEDLKQMYFNYESINSGNNEKLVDMFGDLYFVEGAERVAEIQVRESSEPTYLYEFTYDKDFSAIKAAMMATSMNGMSKFYYRILNYLF